MLHIFLYPVSGIIIVLDQQYLSIIHDLFTLVGNNSSKLLEQYVRKLYNLI
jgi:hypothetical protein